MKIEFYKEILLKRKDELEKILVSISQEIREISKCEVKDEADLAITSMDSGREYQVYLKQKKELEEINEALKRIEKGIYGICKTCAEKIQEERLKIKPFAKYCIICREIIEKENNEKI